MGCMDSQVRLVCLRNQCEMKGENARWGVMARQGLFVSVGFVPSADCRGVALERQVSAELRQLASRVPLRKTSPIADIRVMC